MRAFITGDIRGGEADLSDVGDYTHFRKTLDHLLRAKEHAYKPSNVTHFSCSNPLVLGAQPSRGVWILNRNFKLGDSIVTTVNSKFLEPSYLLPWSVS